MTVFYMVELMFPIPHQCSGYDAFNATHMEMLLSIDGVNSVQRFKATHRVNAPFMAMYTLNHEAVLENADFNSSVPISEVYKPRTLNWHRNVVSGPELHLAVPLYGWLCVVDRVSNDSAPLPAAFQSFKVVGMDRTVVERGLLTGQTGLPPVFERKPGWEVRRMQPVDTRRETEQQRIKRSPVPLGGNVTLCNVESAPQ